MATKSDIGTTALSATEASRAFSKLLDEVEGGGCFLIHRRGRAVCTMAPAPAERRRLSECLALLRARDAVRLDDRFGDDLAEVITQEPQAELPAWDS